MNKSIALTVLLALYGCSHKDAPAELGAKPQVATAQASVKPAAVPAPTPEDWKAALFDTYEETKRKDEEDGTTTFVARFKLPKDGPKSIAFGTRDAFRKLRFYQVGLPVEISTAVGAYISLKDNGRPKLFLKPYYWGRQWIFFDQVAILVNGEVAFDRKCHEVKRDIHGVGVAEKCDLMLSDAEIAALRSINNTSKVVIRFTGKKGYTNVGSDGYNPLKDFVRDIQSAIAIYDMIDAAVASKVPPATDSAST